MGARVFDAWLEEPAVTEGDPNRKKTAEELVAERDATDAKLRFRSLWYDMRQYVKEQGYGHQANRDRLAAYAVWYNTPKELRPVRFQNELATLLGMPDDENFRKWRRQYPDLFSDEAVTSSINKLIMDNMPDVIMSSINCAIHGGYQGYQDRNMLAKIAGLVPGNKLQLEGGDTPISTKGTLTVEHVVDGDTAETIFDILATIGAIESGTGDTEDDEVHSADADT